MSKAKVSQEELNKIREQIKTLKTKLKTEQNEFRKKGGLITDEVLEKMSVKELRGLVAKHKLFKGISRLKKKEIIERIKQSVWYNGQQAPPLPPKRKKKKKNVDIPKAPPPLQEPPTAPSPLTEPPKIITTEKEDRTKLLELDDDDELIDIPEPDKIIDDDLPLEKPKLERQHAVVGETRAEKRRRLLAELEELKSDDEEDHPLISKKEDDKKQMDLGHTIVNVYCGGNSHPDFPVPQSVVRQALNAQNLQPLQQQQVSQFLRQEAQTTPINQAVSQPPVQSLSNIRNKFNKPDVKPAPVKKFPPVKTTKPLQKPIIPKDDDDKPSSSKFEDEDEEEETKEERMKRERAEQIAKEVGRSKGKGKTDKFKNKLEGILGARLSKPPPK
jgi:hypothetical protein